MPFDAACICSSFDGSDQIHVFLAMARWFGEFRGGVGHLHLGAADRASVAQVHPSHLTRGGGGGRGVPIDRSMAMPTLMISTPATTAMTIAMAVPIESAG